jgi:hypothetical protein
VYLDIDRACILRVSPSITPSNLNTKRVLRSLKYGSPKDYRVLCDNVKVINKRASCGGTYGGCFNPRTPHTIFIGADQGNIAYAASILVHEVCHLIQNKENRLMSEKECYAKGAEYLDSVVVY